MSAERVRRPFSHQVQRVKATSASRVDWLPLLPPLARSLFRVDTMEFASSFLQSAASSLAAAAVTKSTLSSNYTDSPSSSSSAGSRTRSPVQIGVWKVHRAQHVSSGKQVSIWTADKHALVGGTRPGRTGSSGGSAGAGTGARADPDRLRLAIDVLKKEASRGPRRPGGCARTLTGFNTRENRPRRCRG